MADNTRVQALLHQALALSPSVREGFVRRQAADDPALIARVLEILARDGVPGHTRSTPPIRPDGPRADGDLAERRGDMAERPGDMIGQYRLLSLIGEGGFGVVWLAERRTPIIQRVALKIIKPGMDSRAVVARFEQERQALAVMDHPNVAKVFDGGVTPPALGSRPYFVMEHVQGEPITEYCDRHNLTVRQRLDLYIHVCEAVQHAHMKGIIHRDLKPSNVLVAIRDEVPVPKVIDFGVAKAISHSFTDKTIFTERGQIIGTPEYMSPEQAEMGAVDIDTRTDVYSLGVMLYELLTSTVPFDAQKLRSKGYNEIQRVIREEEPPRPSTKLTSLGAAAGEIARHRQARPDELARELESELEWIPLKAIRKDRAHRYRTASDLADDIRNYLDGRALSAGPESPAYRLRKFLRRNRVAALAVAAVAATVTVAAVFASAGWIKARQQEKRTHELLVQQIDLTKKAQAAKEQEAVARAAAWRAEQEAVERKEAADFEAYVSNLIAAEASLSRGELRRARERLDACAEGARGWEWRYLNGQTDMSLMLIRGHAQGVLSAEFSPDGTRIVSGGADSTARVWNAVTGRQVCAFEVHDGPVTSAAFSPDGLHALSASADRTARVWDAAKGTELLVLSGHSGPVLGAVFSPDSSRILTVSADRTARLWDVASGGEIATLAGHGAGVLCGNFSPDGGEVVTASADHTARTWDAASGRAKVVLSGHTGVVTWAGFSPDGASVATVSSDRTLRLWNASDGKENGAFSPVTGRATRACFTPDGRVLLTASDREVRAWDTGSGDLLAVLRGHEGAVRWVAASADGARVVTGSDDGSLRVWDGGVGAEVVVLAGHRDETTSAVFSPDGTQVVTTSDDGRVRVFDALTGDPLAVFEGGDEMFESAAFSADGRRVITSSHEGAVQVWDAATGARVSTPSGQGQEYTSACSPDGSRLVVAAPGWKAQVREVTSGKELFSLLGHEGAVNHAAFSPDGDRIVTSSDDRTARLWSAASGRPLGRLEGHTASVYHAEFGPGGRRVVTLSNDRTARVWDAASGALLATLQGRDEQILSAVFGPDGSRIVTASDARSARLWETDTGRELYVLYEPDGGVYRAAFSPDGTRIVTTSYDSTLRLWDARSGRELLLLRGHRGPVLSACFSGDGTRLLTASRDRTARLWDTLAHRERYAAIAAYRAAKDELRPAVERRLSAGEPPDKVRAWIAGDGSLDPLRRRGALALVSQERDRRTAEALALNNAAWQAILQPGLSAADAAAALDKARRASALLPDDGDVTNTLGVALYRHGDHAEALETLLRSERQLAGATRTSGPVPPQSPANWAYIAMSQFRLGRSADAAASLAKLRALVNSPKHADHHVDRLQLQEAEALIEIPTP